jgi:flagellar biosynthetic protein FliQ
MNVEQVIDILREAMLVTLIVSGPLMIIGTVIGVAISLLQAVTQIQEMSISFVPKILALFLSSLIFLPFMMTTMFKFTEFIMDKIAVGGG